MGRGFPPSQDDAGAAGQPAGLPRIFCVTDPAARVAAVIERRPRKWWRLGRWDLVSGAYEEGAWFRGTLYPQRCDLAPGGRWRAYFAFKNDSAWPAGPTYNAISRLPWLRALAAWRGAGTWSRGLHFVADTGVWEVGDPAVGDVAPLRGVVGIRPTAAAQFATERRRGWRELAESPPRDPGDVWDDRRELVMEKPSPEPGSPGVLSVRERFEAFREAPLSRPAHPAPYSLKRGRSVCVLPDVRWGDWTYDGHLAVATKGGCLQIRDGSGAGWFTRRDRRSRSRGQARGPRGPASGESPRRLSQSLNQTLHLTTGA